MMRNDNGSRLDPCGTPDGVDTDLLYATKFRYIGISCCLERLASIRVRSTLNKPWEQNHLNL